VGTEDVDTEVTTFDGSHWLSADNKPASSLRCNSLVAKRRRDDNARLERLSAMNTRHCDQFVVYGSDIHDTVDCLSTSSWSDVGYVHCMEAQLGGLLQRPSAAVYWRQTDALKQATCTPEDHLRNLRDVLDR